MENLMAGYCAVVLMLNLKHKAIYLFYKIFTYVS